MTTKEIITIQFGPYANMVGGHWLNIQQTNFNYDEEFPSEIDPFVLYREGKMDKDTAYSPRLLMVDLKGTIGYLHSDGSFSKYYEQNENKPGPEILWEENRVETITEPEATKSDFMKVVDQQDVTLNYNDINYENDIKKWVDFLMPRLHSKTINIIQDYEYGSTTRPFDVFTYGQNLWNATQFSNDFTDNIRFYAEECDFLRGFHVLIDGDDGFSGLGASCLQYLRDEYGKSILSFPVTQPAYKERSLADYVKIINMTLCWQQLGEHSSLFSPLCCDANGWLPSREPRNFKNLTYRPDLQYHTSSLLATALDTLTLRYRQKKYPMATLSDLCADLNKLGRKAVATSLSLPFPIDVNKELIEMLDSLEETCPWTTITPGCNINVHSNMQSLALRGIPECRLKAPLCRGEKQMERAAYKCETVHEMMSFYLETSCQSSASYLCCIEHPLKIQNPYPKVFNSNVSKDGNLSEEPRTKNVESLPVMAGLHTGKFIAKMYESLHKSVNKIKKLNKFHAFLDSGLEQDDFQESINNLIDCQKNYEDQY